MFRRKVYGDEIHIKTEYFWSRYYCNATYKGRPTLTPSSSLISPKCGMLLRDDSCFPRSGCSLWCETESVIQLNPEYKKENGIILTNKSETNSHPHPPHAYSFGNNRFLPHSKCIGKRYCSLACGQKSKLLRPT